MLLSLAPLGGQICPPRCLPLILLLDRRVSSSLGKAIWLRKVGRRGREVAVVVVAAVAAVVAPSGAIFAMQILVA